MDFQDIHSSVRMIPTVIPEYPQSGYFGLSIKMSLDWDLVKNKYFIWIEQ